MDQNIENFSVKNTNCEALISKISAINKGYFKDSFAHLFISTTVKKEVIINRGYWARYQIFHQIIDKFLALNSGMPK